MKVRDESLFSVSRKMRPRYSLCVVFALLFRFSSGIVPFSFLLFLAIVSGFILSPGSFLFWGMFSWDSQAFQFLLLPPLEG